MSKKKLRNCNKHQLHTKKSKNSSTKLQIKCVHKCSHNIPWILYEVLLGFCIKFSGQYTRRLWWIRLRLWSWGIMIRKIMGLWLLYQLIDHILISWLCRMCSLGMELRYRILLLRKIFWIWLSCIFCWGNLGHFLSNETKRNTEICTKQLWVNTSANF